MSQDVAVEIQGQQESVQLRVPNSVDRAAGEEKTKFSAIAKLEGPNPFTTSTPLNSCYEWTKTILMTITLIPFIRALLCVILLLIMWMICLLIRCFCITPGSCWYSVFLWPLRILARSVMFVYGHYWIGTTNDTGCSACCRSLPPVLVANHVGIMDHFKIFYDTGCSAAAADYLFAAPVIGTILTATFCVPMRRETAVGRENSLTELSERIRLARDEGWPPVLVFAQGTTTKTTVLSTFKRGAFVVGTDIMPISITIPHCHFDGMSGIRWSGAWYFFRGLCQFVSHGHYHYMKPYTPNEEEKADPYLYGRNVRSIIAADLGATVTELEYDDTRLIIAASKHQIPKVDFRASSAKSMFGFTGEEILALGKRFTALDTEGLGRLDFDTFVEGVGLDPHSSVSRRLFVLFDTDGNGAFEFREYLAVIGVLTRGHPEADCVRILFEICDRDGDHVVYKPEMLHVLSLIQSICVDIKADSPQSGVDHSADVETSPYRLCYILQHEVPLADVMATLFPDQAGGLSFRQFHSRLAKYPDFPRAAVRLLLLSRIGGLLPGVEITTK